MIWPERLDLILDIAAHIPWRWFVAGAICGVVLGAMIVIAPIVVAKLEHREMERNGHT